MVLEPGAAGRGSRIWSGGCSCRPLSGGASHEPPQQPVAGSSFSFLKRGSWKLGSHLFCHCLEASSSPLHEQPKGPALPSPGASTPTPSTLHPTGTSPFPHTLCLGQDHDVAGEPHVAGGAAFQRDGVAVEVVQHLHDGGEAEVLDPALPPLRQRQPQVLQRGAGTCHPPSWGYLGWGTQMPSARGAASSACGSLGIFSVLGDGHQPTASTGAETRRASPRG